MNIVIPDSQLLPSDVEFPPLTASKFGWQQFLGLDEDELKERCWRSHCVVTLNTSLNAEVLNSMLKLELLVVANHDISLVDTQTAEKNNVTIFHIPDLEPSKFDLNNPQQAQQLCNTVVDIIDNYMQQTA